MATKEAEAQEEILEEITSVFWPEDCKKILNIFSTFAKKLWPLKTERTFPIRKL